MKNALGIIINNPSKELAALTGHRNPLTLPFFARYRLIDFTLSNLVNSNINKIGIIASDKYRSLLDHVGTGQEWGLSRKSNGLIILQGIRKIGSVNSRDINLMDFEKNNMVFRRNLEDNILILSPNVVCRIDYNEVIERHMDSGADITLIAKRVEDCQDRDDRLFMNVEDDEVTEFTVGKNHKSTHQYCGKLVVRRETLIKLIEMAPEVGEYEMLTLIMELFDKLDVRCYTFEGYLRKIKSVNDYFNASMELLDIDTAHELFNEKDTIFTKNKDNHPTLYKSTSEVSSSCIASGSIIHGKIENSILFRQVMQERNSTISNSIIMEGCHVGEGTQLDYVIADRNVTIRKNVVLKGTKESPVVLKKEMII